MANPNLPAPNPRDWGHFGEFGDMLRGAEGGGDWGAPGVDRPAQPDPGQPPAVPWTREDAIEQYIKYRRVPIYPPFANLAKDPSVIYMVRPRPAFFGGAGVAAAVLPQFPMQFSQPTIVYARTATAILTDNNGLPVGRPCRNQFSCFMQRTNGDSIDGGTTPILGDAIFGSGGEPALYAANGVFFNNGASLSINVTSLIDNTLVHIVLWTIEEYGNPTAPRGQPAKK